MVSGTPKLNVRVFAAVAASGLALTLANIVDDVGHPLLIAQILESGPIGTGNVATDLVSGSAMVGQGVGTVGERAGGGKLLLDPNTFVNFTQPSSLNMAGELEVQNGARLRLDGANPARDLTLAAGSVTRDSGTLQFEGGNRLVLTADTIFGFGLVDFLGSSTIISGSTLTIPSGAAIRFDHGSTNDGPVVVNGRRTPN